MATNKLVLKVQQIVESSASWEARFKKAIEYLSKTYDQKLLEDFIIGIIHVDYKSSDLELALSIVDRILYTKIENAPFLGLLDDIYKVKFPQRASYILHRKVQIDIGRKCNPKICGICYMVFSDKY